MYVYRWVGEWKEQYIGSFANVPLEGQPQYYEYEDFHVVTEQDFFAVIDKTADTETGDAYAISLWHKNPSARGNWINTSLSRGISDGLPSLMSGSNFIAIGELKGGTYRFVFNGTGWNETYDFPVAAVNHYFTASNNYYIKHMGETGIYNPLIWFSYLTEDKRWITNSLPANCTFSSDERSYWHSSNSMAVAMADNNPEFVYRWNLQYLNFTKESKDKNNVDLFGQINPDHYPFVYIINNSLIGIKGKLARFDGKYWYGATVSSTWYSTDWGYMFAYGDDVVVRPIENTGGDIFKGARKEFNPNQLLWKSDYVMQGDDLGYNRATMGLGYYFFGKHYYFRDPNGTWAKIYSYPNIDLKLRETGYPSYDINFDTYPFQIFNLNLIKNRQLYSTLYLNNNNLVFNVNRFKCRGVGHKTIVTYPNSFNAAENATTLKLYRLVNDEIHGSQTDLTVTKIISNDGLDNRSSCISYNYATAVMDPSGSFALYNEVSVTPECNSTTYGYTKNFYFNGLTGGELGNSQLVTDLRWNGLNYETYAYNSSSVQVAFSKNTFTNYSRDFTNTNGTKVDVGFYVRPYQITNLSDQVTTLQTNEFASETGLLKTVTTENKSGSSSFFKKVTETKYWWEVYDPSRTKNILTPAIQQKLKNNDGQYVESTATRWKDWNCTACSSTVSAPYQNYSWKGTGSVDFVAWSESQTPDAAIWKLDQSLAIDSKGQIVETQDRSGLKESKIYHSSRPILLAEASNAASNQILYEGFESSTSNFSTTSKVGLKSCNAPFTVVLPSAGTYKLSHWQKNGSADWQLTEQIISGNVQIGGAGILIDEIRLHPPQANITSFSYDDNGNLISVCDPNNIISHKEYDDFGRTKLVRDQDLNIIQHFFYNIKN